jgi:glutamine synthetase
MLRGALGADVLEHYCHAADWEQRQHDSLVTDWEIRRGFERG